MLVIIVGVPLLLLFVYGCDFCERRGVGPIFIQEAGRFFFATCKRAMIGIGLLTIVWFVELFVLEFGPEYELSIDLIMFGVFEVLGLFLILAWVDLRFQPIKERELALGEHLDEVAIAKSKSLVALQEFFEGLVNGFEGQPERSGTAHYNAAKERFLLRDDEIGTVFKLVLSEWISKQQNSV